MCSVVDEVKEKYDTDDVYAEAFDWWCAEIMPDYSFEEQAETFDNALVGCYSVYCEEEAVRDVLEQDHDLLLDEWPICLIDTSEAFRDIKEDYWVRYATNKHYFWVCRQEEGGE